MLGRWILVWVWQVSDIFPVYNKVTWDTCMSSDCLWCAWTTDIMGCKENTNMKWHTVTIAFLFVETFFQPSELIEVVTECPFLYCNQIELFDIVLPAVFWLGVFASRLNLVWVRFAFISPNDLICSFMLNPLHQFDLCGTANIICIWYPWLLSYCHPLRIKTFFLGFMSEVIAFWNMETIHFELHTELQALPPPVFWLCNLQVSCGVTKIRLILFKQNKQTCLDQR